MNNQFPQKDLVTALLMSFKISFYDFEEVQGNTVTLYKFRPQLGTRISRIRALKDELSAALFVPSVRIIAPMEDGSVETYIRLVQQPHPLCLKAAELCRKMSNELGGYRPKHGKEV